MSRFLASLFLLLGATALPAQDPAAAPAAAPAMTARLETDAGVLTAGQSFTVRLVVEFRAAAEVPATMLGGVDLATFVDGEPSKPIQDLVEGTVRVAAGTTLVREVPVDTAATWPDGELAGGGIRVLGVAWQGVDGASATLRIVPDQSDLDLAALDYTQTKVRFVTSKGELVIGFRPDKAPNHVRNFVKLSKEGFYDGTRFHRILSGFMAQGGCPNTKVGADGMPGTGSPGYTVDAEFSDYSHVRGVVSMARGPDPNSAGSQFFLMHGDRPILDGRYTAFGQIESGLDVLDRIAETPVRPNPRGEPSVPVEDVWLYAAVVEPAFKE